MRFIEKLFGKAVVPTAVISDPSLGRLTWSKEDDAWIGSRDGLRIELSDDRKPAPSRELVEYAKEILADPSWLLGDFEQEKKKWVTRVPANSQHELAALKIGSVCFSMHKGRRFIFASVDGGRDKRCWRIMWLDRKCDGLGFDT